MESQTRSYPFAKVAKGQAAKPRSLRVHKKSRNGCLQCKRRKVKCDEKGPRCHNCKYRGMTCSFQADYVDFTQDDSTLRQRDSSKSPSGTLALQEQYKCSVSLMDRPRVLDGDSRLLCDPMMKTSTFIPGTYTLADLELMHHYVTKTFFLLADYEAYRPVWEMIVPREAQANEFLMRGILALSALHIGHLREKVSNGSSHERQKVLSYYEAAQRHYNHAVSGFNTTVKHMTPANTNAVFAFSHLSIFFAFGSSSPTTLHSSRAIPFLLPSSQAHCPENLDSPIDSLLSVVTLLRKSMTVLRSSWALLEESSMAVLLQRGPQITNRMYLPGEIRDALNRLKTLILVHPELSSDVAKRNIYLTALSTLTSSFVMAETKRQDWPMALRFAMLVSERFLGYIRAREPLALVFLAYYCVLLHRAPARWWAGGWAGWVVKEIWARLEGTKMWREREIVEWCASLVVGKCGNLCDKGSINQLESSVN